MFPNPSIAPAIDAPAENTNSSLSDPPFRFSKSANRNVPPIFPAFSDVILIVLLELAAVSVSVPIPPMTLSMPVKPAVTEVAVMFARSIATGDEIEKSL